MAHWTAPAFLDALTTQIAARAGIIALTPTVRVLAYYPGPDEPLTDAILLGFTVTDSNEPAALGNQSHQEDVTIDCEIRVVRPGAGSSPASAARDRAALILGEIHDEVATNWPQVGTQTIAARVQGRTMTQFPYQAGETATRVCLIEFQILYKARTTP